MSGRLGSMGSGVVGSTEFGDGMEAGFRSPLAFSFGLLSSSQASFKYEGMQ